MEYAILCLLQQFFDCRALFLFVMASSEIVMRVFLEATYWIVFSLEVALWSLSLRCWSLSPIGFKFSCRLMLNPSFYNSLVPYTPWFVCSVWKQDKVSCRVDGRGIGVSVGLAETDPTTSEAQSGSTTFHGGGKCGILFAAEEAMATFLVSANMVTLDPTISLRLQLRGVESKHDRSSRLIMVTCSDEWEE